MTLVVTISASTAASAIEALKPARRVAAKDRAADIKADADRGVRRAQNVVSSPASDSVAPAMALSLDLMTTDQEPQQQATHEQVQAAYRDLDD